MKKKLMTAALLTMTMLLAGCAGKDEGSEAAKSSAGIDPEDYVTIGSLEGIEVTAEIEGEITEADIDAQIDSELNYYVQYANLYDYEAVPDKTVVENGDMVNIDYEGVKDGEAFSGGTAEGSYLEIGSGSFIDGFESGLVGHSVGETVDLNLTFPENYQSEDLAGQAVVFHVTINSIHDADKQLVPEFDDAFIQKANFGFSTMEEYRADVKEYMEQQRTTNNETAVEDAIWDAVYAACEVSGIPQVLIDEVKERVYDNAESYAQQYGMELADFISSNMNMTEEEFEAEALSVSEESAKEKLVMRAIAKQQGIEISKKQINEAAEEEMADAGYETVDEYIAAVGGEDVYKDYLLSKKVDEYLKSVITVHEVIKEKEVTETVSDNSAEKGTQAVSDNSTEDSMETETDAKENAVTE